MSIFIPARSTPPPADRIRPDQPENTARSRLRASRWAAGDTFRLSRSPRPSGRASKGCYPGICGARVAGSPAGPEHLEDSGEWPGCSLTGPMKGSTHDQREMSRPARPGAFADMPWQSWQSCQNLARFNTHVEPGLALGEIWQKLESYWQDEPLKAKTSLKSVFSGFSFYRPF